MKSAGLKAIILVLLTLALTGCPSQPPAQSVATNSAPPVPPPVVVPDVNSIQPEKDGFSPGADSPANFITFDLRFAHATDLQTWKITFQDAHKVVQRTITGTSASLPPTQTWDGKTDKGQLAPQGSYTATLAVDYGKKLPAAAQTSIPFFLDVIPPAGSVTISPNPYSPTPEDIPDALHLQVTTQNGGGQVVSWRLQIIDQNGVVFKNFISEDHRDGSISWDGRADSNGLLKSPSTYKVVLKIFDQWGNRAQADSQLVVGLLAVKDGNRMRIPVEPVIFKAYTANYTDVQSDLAQRNKAALDEIASRLKTFGTATILIEGHANKVFWYNKAKGEREQRDVLIPLSRDRANAIRRALIERGIPADRLKAVGLGADDPVVPFSDTAKTWENRRVVFYLN